MYVNLVGVALHLTYGHDKKGLASRFKNEVLAKVKQRVAQLLLKTQSKAKEVVRAQAAIPLHIKT
jgi:hypothetical protein